MSFERRELEVESKHQDLATVPAIGKVARKAVSMSFGDSLARSPVGTQLGGASEPHGEGMHGEAAHGEAAHGEGAQDAEPGGAAATATAEDGFRGTPRDLPHRAALEKSFGVSLAGVKAYTDAHARRATERLGAKAYASGNRIAFRMADPDQALVAHEVTHVLQHTGHRLAKKSEGGGDGIETSGEGEAERVEAQVAAGKPAHAALEGAEGHGAEGHGAEPDAEHGPGEVAASSAMTKRPARSKTAFGSGMGFSPNRFEKEESYTLWSKEPPIEVPVGAVPGLNLIVDPSVKVKAAAGVKFGKRRLRAHLGVDGQVGVGFSYGKSEIAALYGESQATLNGGFTYERSQTHHKIHDWDLNGQFTLGTQFAVGVKLGGGVIDAKFEFGHCDIGTLSGLHWDNGKFDRNHIGWAWGSGPNAFFQKINALIHKVEGLLKLPQKAVKGAWKSVSGEVKHLGGAIKKIHIPDITPWKGLLPI